ncbi:MAG: PH domain-containing protein [Candidatus Moranbacteria bacterium]|nr:PH domain-containing protein [Candidatus Moranbacteria bacterium]MDX9855564.1 PH domain-containing protein [Candidatus Moranbacteria bacterium]
MDRFKNFHFRGQHSEEKIIKIVRRHWFNIFQQYLIIFAMVFLLILSIQILPGILSIPTNSPEFWFVESFFAIIIWIYIFILWIDFYFDVWIITDNRIVNIEQKALFMRHISELDFSKIQDVSTEVDGLIPTVLNYGDVHIQTAGTRGRFLFHKVPDPYGLKGLIMDMQNRVARKKVEKNKENKSPFLENDV